MKFFNRLQQPIGFLFVSVFPQEFPNLENGAECTKNGTYMLRSHDRSHPIFDNIIASYGNLKDCKLYCSSEKSCCGCINICNVTCLWHALTDCKQMQSSYPGSEQCVVKKPGNSPPPSSIDDYIYLFLI